MTDSNCGLADGVVHMHSDRCYEAGRHEALAEVTSAAALRIPCGGCRNEGSHQKFCPRRPGYHPWDRLAALAEDIGDTIGGNDPGLANRAYALSGAINAAKAEHPYRAPAKS